MLKCVKVEVLIISFGDSFLSERKKLHCLQPLHEGSHFLASFRRLGAKIRQRVSDRPMGQTISVVSRYKLVSRFYEFLTTPTGGSRINRGGKECYPVATDGFPFPLVVVPKFV